jgi:hypothetical protein
MHKGVRMLERFREACDCTEIVSQWLLLARALVVFLHDLGCPPAILGAIVSVHVFAVNRFAARAFAQIGKEVYKSLRAVPARAHTDSATAIVFV